MLPHPPLAHRQVRPEFEKHQHTRVCVRHTRGHSGAPDIWPQVYASFVSIAHISLHRRCNGVELEPGFVFQIRISAHSPPSLLLNHKRRQMKLWRTANVFTAAEVQRAFAALHQNAEALYSVSGTSSLLRPFVRRRGRTSGHRRDHMELPLHHMYESNTVYQQLPVEVRLICAGLHEVALSYAQEALQEPGIFPDARDEILNNLGRNSVLRVLRYPAGCGCRPHVDPGLCTALLAGSAGGLEVSTTDAALTSFANRPGHYAAHVDPSPTSMHDEASHMPDTLPHWEPFLTAHSGEAVVMAGNMLGAVSGGTLPGVLHRVRRDWAAATPPMCEQGSPPLRAACINNEADTEMDTGNGVFRFNVVVELRPADAKRWYAAASDHSLLSST
ncbi:hypothetical protein, conserved [Leishmania tarentolae]|uniref:Uncharacterized protein n=1 Tax=Leishmania tarentolae TaxID=5689 RepID=A0A640KE32_LEITA|nr:hypothetical protein, conserved [Leishmania tarentolae]